VSQTDDCSGYQRFERYLLVQFVEALGEVNIFFRDTASVVGGESNLDFPPVDNHLGMVPRLLGDAAGARGKADTVEIRIELVGPDDFVAIAGPSVGKLCLDFLV
jgi:hypothetical protein